MKLNSGDDWARAIDVLPWWAGVTIVDSKSATSPQIGHDWYSYRALTVYPIIPYPLATPLGYCLDSVSMPLRLTLFCMPFSVAPCLLPFFWTVAILTRTCPSVSPLKRALVSNTVNWKIFNLATVRSLRGESHSHNAPFAKNLIEKCNGCGIMNTP